MSYTNFKLETDADGIALGTWDMAERSMNVINLTVIEELARLKALYHGFGYRELARILLHKTHYRIDDKTVKRLWEHSASPVQGELPFSA